MSGAGLPRIARVVAHGPESGRRDTTWVPAMVSAAVALFVTLIGGLALTDPLDVDALPASSTESKAVLALGDFAPGSFSRPAETRPAPPPAARQPQPPKHSGHGKRVIYDLSAQRVWLVSAQNDVTRTYPVSGGLSYVVAPGTYEVYSKSRHAIGVDGSQLEYMVRFAHGTTAAIGFHDIPVLNGKPVQTRAELGTPRSHGCIRQRHVDAKALWRFAPVGTTVVVLA